MINWEAAFITPYSQTLANGTIGNARQHARVITNNYINAIRLGSPFGIPPTLPAPAAFGAPAPVGPGVFFNLYETRRQLFENTIYVYYQGKSLLHSKSNIQDLIVSLKRLQTKAKQLRDRIKNLQTELRIVDENIRQLPDQFREFFEDLKQIIEDQIAELKSLNLDGRASVDEAFATTFAEEINFYNAIVNFKPSLNPANYSIFLDLYTQVANQYKKLTTNDGFKVYILNKIQTVIQYVLTLVQGFVDPTEILLFIKDIAATSVVYKPTYEKAVKLLRLQKVLVKTQTRIKKEIDEEKKRLSGIIKPKIDNLKKVVNARLNSYKSALLEYKQSLSKYEFVKQIQDFTKRQKKKIKKRKQQIKRIRIITQQVRDVQSELETIISNIKVDYRKLLLELKQVDNFNIVAELSIEDMTAIKDYSTQRLQDLSIELIGKGSTTFGVLLGLTDLPTNAKNQLKVKLNTVDTRYQSYLDSLTTAIIKTKTISKLLDITTANTIQDDKLIDIQVNKVLLESNAEIANAIQKRRLRGKSTARDVFFLIDDLNNLLSLFAPKTAKLVKELEDALKADLKAFEENNKFLKEIKVVNAKIKQRFNQKEKTEQEAREKAERAKKAKKRIEKAQQFAIMTTAAAQIATNVSQKRYMLSVSEQPLKRFINSYYKYQEINKENNTQQILREKQKTIKDLDQLIQYETFAALLVEFYNNVDIKAFTNEIQEAVKNYQIPQLEQQDLDRLVQSIRSLSPITVDGVISSTADLSYEFISKFTNFTALQLVESKYTKRFLQIVDQYEALSNNKTTQPNNSVFKQFFADIKKSGSVILTLIKYVKKYVIKPGIEFINKHIQSVIKKVEKKIKQESQKLKESTKEFRQKLKDKLVNVDAIAMSIMFNIATRLFWTGAVWTNPVGTTFVITNIGTFRKIKALPKDGAAGIAREMGLNFKTQLTVATGQAIPNPATGIPPFPFVGYI